MLATAIALYNYKLPVRVAQAFALAMLAGLTTYNSNTLLPKLTNGKQACHHKFIKEWLEAKG
jgi:thiazole synthase ThiGH ThiG subunit